MIFPRFESRRRALIAPLLIASLVWTPACLKAEEGGSGHYVPGSMSDLADGVPLQPAFIVRYNELYYSGSISATKPLPIVGVTVLGLHATSWGEGITLLWRPPIDTGKRWSYAMSATIPFLQMSVDAKAIVPPIIGKSGYRNALGDIVVMPLLLNYNVSPAFNMNFRVGVYLPTGDYATGRLANTGKNFYTVEPTWGFMYLSPKSGREASVFTGLDFNTENYATNYLSGTQFHVDGTLAQHLPLLKGLAGLGVNAYYYQQITDDGGIGAKLGPFRGTTTGLGPVVSYDKKFKSVEILGDLKWLNEVYTKNRLQGNIVWLKVVFKF